MQVQDRINPQRRRLTTGLLLGVVGSLAGCGGADETPQATTAAPATPAAPTPPAPASPTAAAPLAWEVAPARSLALAPGSSFNLATTLPASVRSGGVYEVDPEGSPLPPGISLSPGGLLLVSSGATGSTAGVIFRYTPPA